MKNYMQSNKRNGLLREAIRRNEGDGGELLGLDFRTFLQGIPQARQQSMKVMYLMFTQGAVYANQSSFLKYEFHFDPSAHQGNVSGQGNIALEAHPEYDAQNPPAEAATPAALLLDMQAMDDDHAQNPDHVNGMTLPVVVHFVGANDSDIKDVFAIYEDSSDVVYVVNNLQGTGKTVNDVAQIIQLAVAYVMSARAGNRSLMPDNIARALTAYSMQLSQLQPNAKAAMLDKMSLLFGFLPLSVQEELLTSTFQQRNITASENGTLHQAGVPQLQAPAA